MDYGQFINHAQERVGVEDCAGAERLTQATLETLAERLMQGERDDLAAQLPAEYRVLFDA